MENLKSRKTLQLSGGAGPRGLFSVVPGARPQAAAQLSALHCAGRSFPELGGRGNGDVL